MRTMTNGIGQKQFHAEIKKLKKLNTMETKIKTKRWLGKLISEKLMQT